MAFLPKLGEVISPKRHQSVLGGANVVDNQRTAVRSMPQAGSSFCVIAQLKDFYINGIKGNSPMLVVDLVRSFKYDEMHGIYLGVAREIASSRLRKTKSIP